LDEEAAGAETGAGAETDTDAGTWEEAAGTEEEPAASKKKQQLSKDPANGTPASFMIKHNKKSRKKNGSKVILGSCRSRWNRCTGNGAASRVAAVGAMLATSANGDPFILFECPPLRNTRIFPSSFLAIFATTLFDALTHTHAKSNGIWFRFVSRRRRRRLRCNFLLFHSRSPHSGAKSKSNKLKLQLSSNRSNQFCCF